MRLKGNLPTPKQAEQLHGTDQATQLSGVRWVHRVLVKKMIGCYHIKLQGSVLAVGAHLDNSSRGSDREGTIGCVFSPIGQDRNIQAFVLYC